MEKLKRFLFREVDASSLAVFRIGFGFIMAFDAYQYLFKYCISCYWNDPDFLFKYYGFGWVQPLPGTGMTWLWVALGILAVMIMLGWFYRFAIIVFTVLFTYQFLLDQARYLNHFYLVIVFAVLMCLVPANRYLALDARRRPDTASPVIPFWPLFVLGAQLEIVLIYAGLVKLNWDWLNLEPLRMWLVSRADLPIVGQLFVHDWAVAVAAYGVIALHLIGAPLLMFRKTRLVVLCIYATFHTLNHFVFEIGIFPWFTLFASLLLFSPNWPKQVFSKVRRAWPIFREDVFLPVAERFSTARLPSAGTQLLITGVMAAWLSTQLLIPLRHLALPGDVAWNEAGHRFSWRMKLRDKKGDAIFTVQDGDSNARRKVDPRRVLTSRQVIKMSCQPDMILQFAHYIGDSSKDQLGWRNPRVTAEVFCSLNGRSSQRLVVGSVDLYRQERELWSPNWITTLTEPLSDPWLFSHNEQ